MDMIAQAGQYRPLLSMLVFSGLPIAIIPPLSLAVSIGAWAYFGSALASTVSPPWMKICVFSVGVSGVLGPQVLFFNNVLQTEGISTSALVAFCAALLFTTVHRKHWVGVLLLGLSLVFIRDTWLYFVPLAAMLPFVGRFRKLVSYVVLVPLMLGVYAAACMADTGHRYVYPLKNNLHVRILHDQDARDLYFQGSAASPLPSLDAFKGEWGGECKLTGAEWTWITKEGKPRYQRWLLATLPQRLVEMANDYERIFPVDMYAAHVYVLGQPGDIRPDQLKHVERFAILGRSDPQSIGALFCVLIALWLAAAIHLREVSISATDRVGIMIVALGAGNIFISYWGDSMEIGRHCLGGVIAVSLGLTVLCVGSLGKLALERQGSPIKRATNAI